jgi:hypothetical protein
MKETNPIAFRLGGKFLWNVNSQTKFFTENYLLNIKIYQFLYLYLFKYFIIIIFNYKIFKYENTIILYFNIYLTNLFYKLRRRLQPVTYNYIANSKFFFNKQFLLKKDSKRNKKIMHACQQIVFTKKITYTYIKLLYLIFLQKKFFNILKNLYKGNYRLLLIKITFFTQNFLFKKKKVIIIILIIKFLIQNKILNLKIAQNKEIQTFLFKKKVIYLKFNKKIKCRYKALRPKLIFNFFKVLKKLKIRKKKIKIKKKKIKMIVYKTLISKYYLENILYSILQVPNKIFFTGCLKIFKNDKQLSKTTFNIYNKIIYIRRYIYFIDLVNILSLNLTFKHFQITSLLHFIINELSRTKRHRPFLNNFKQVLIKLIKIKKFSYLTFKIIVTGPIGKHGRTKFFKFETKPYTVVLQSLKYNTFYNMGYCLTPFGTLGVRLWISSTV